MINKCVLLLLFLTTLGVTTALASDFPDPVSNVVTVEITQTTEFVFTPEVTGYWVFRTSDNGDCDPYLWLRNMYGLLIAVDDDSGGDSNALLIVHLVGGADYLLEAGFWQGNTGRYTLSVYLVDRFVRPPSPWDDWDWDNHWDNHWVDWDWDINRDGTWYNRQPPIFIPDEGGSFSVESFRVVYFTPNTAGLWAFDLQGYGSIEINDPLGNRLLWLDSSNEEPDEMFTVHLVEGVQYRIIISPYWNRELMTATVFYSETVYPWLQTDMLEEFRPNLKGEYVQLQTGQQDLQGGQLFTFVPPESGIWRFEATDFSISGWGLLLTVSDRYFSFHADSWLWRNDDNSIVTAYLTAGFEYILRVERTHIMEPPSPYYGNFSLSIAMYEVEVPHQANETTQMSPPPPPPPVLAVLHEPNHITISPTGGQYAIPTYDEITVFSFTPAVTGTWVVQAGADTIVVLRDTSRSFFVSNRWGAITLNLAAGVEYFIEVDTWGTGCILLVSPFNQIHTFAPGIEIQRPVVRETDFSFIPNQSGVWVIETLSNWQIVDPYLWLLDADGNIIAEDDDSGGNLNALIKMQLTAGEEYTIRAGFYADSVGGYALRVRMLNMAEPERPRLASPTAV